MYYDSLAESFSWKKKKKNWAMHPNHAERTNLKVTLKWMQETFMLGWVNNNITTKASLGIY